MFKYKETFDTFLGVQSKPNNHELHLLKRAEKYIQKIVKIPGIEMVAIVNSLSMYATNTDSDIDLFIVTRPNMIWFVRFFVTLTFWMHGVWRRGDDIAGNFCLSFFVTTDAMDLSKVSIENDIYLYYWIYYMKPIFIKNNTYDKFLKANSWVEIDEEQKMENQKHSIKNSTLLASLFLFNHKTKEYFYKKINQIIRFFILPKTLNTYEKLGRPEGVIISDTILKFHDQDQRKVIRDTILKKNFDK